MYKAYEVDSLINRHTQSLVHAIANVQDGQLVARLSKAGLAMVDASFWFSGLRQSLAKMALKEQTGLASKIISACEKVQTDLQAFHANLSDIDAASPDLAAQCAHCKECAALLHDELEQLRWDAMEWLADADHQAGRVTGPFASAEALMTSLMH